MVKIKRALISVTDKKGITEFAKELAGLGVEIISTGGTAKILTEAGIKVVPISSYTGFPEMLDGRVKTLHPKIHGGILGVRDKDSHVEDMKAHDILPIDMVVVNLYRFEETIAGGATLDEAIENIDIGGPGMIRASAKNNKFVSVVTEPGDYACILEEMKVNEACVSATTRLTLAKKAFALTARYDGAIANYLTSLSSACEPEGFPATLTMQFEKLQDLRYGENPHQKAVYYKNQKTLGGALTGAKKLHGKELSYNNILDINSAVSLTREFSDPAAILIKHNNPCGAAVSSAGLVDAYTKALACDSTSAFGGIFSFNREVTEELAAMLKEVFFEAVIAPSFDEAALKILTAKKNLRILELKGLGSDEAPQNAFEIKTVSGGILVQDPDATDSLDLQTSTKRSPSAEELEDLRFAWNVAKHVKSNTIVLVRGGATIGIGAGQMSRIDATKISVMKAESAKLDVKGTVLASDAFFPFRDNVDLAAKYGVTAIIQPGGSIRDEEVITAADENDIAMVFTSIRHFRH
ncbi:MAG: bifunctional phosphoribosylaminoimidazolecarboxamide formyltransferase/IMP cyclohydrolase [Thermodesulfobacteriota bacterium]